MKAVCVLRNQKTGKVHGTVLFKELQKTGSTRIQIKIAGIKPGLHGFHIHESGDLRKGCQGLCAHYNPYEKNHGGRRSNERHLGDLGNVKANEDGIVQTSFTDHHVKLRGKYSVIGRSVIVHADRDDLGKGGDAESLKTGNAGKRILCGVIGIVTCD